MVITSPRQALYSATIFLVLAGAAVAEAQTTRVSVATDDGSEGDGHSLGAVMSGDGQFVAFYSLSSNLVPGDTNGTFDVFVHDRDTGDTTRVSLTPEGTQFLNGAGSPAISANGRFVAFSGTGTSTASYTQVYLHDRLLEDTVRLSNNFAGSGGGNGNSYVTSLTVDADGLVLVAFESDASDLVSDDTNGQRDVFVFVRDATTGKTTRVSLANDRTEANEFSTNARISADGRFVVFESYASNLVAGDTNNRLDVFIHERRTGHTRRVSVAGENIQANAESEHPAVSANGRWVAFSSFASNLVAGDTNGTWDVFLRDMEERRTSRVSVNSRGGEANSRSDFPAISDDGSFVAFDSFASNLVFADTNRATDIFLHARDSGVTTRASLTQFNTQANSGNDGSRRPAFSADGRFLAFESDATNLVANDTNERRDVFVRVIPAATTPTAPTNLSAQVRGSTVSFTWTAPTGGGLPDRYRLRASRTPGATDFELVTPGAVPAFDATSIPPATYYVRVHAENDFGVGPASNEVIVAFVPAAPESLTATVRGSNVTFNWNLPTAGGLPDTYLFRVGLSPGATDLEFNTGSKATVFDATNVPEGTYHVRVHGRNGSGTGPPSNEVVVEIRPPGCTEAPGPPTALTATVTGGVVSLSWGASPGCPATSYVLDAGTAPGASNVFVGDVGNVSALGATVRSGTYFVRVRGRNHYGVSGPSNEVTVIVP